MRLRVQIGRDQCSGDSEEKGDDKKREDGCGTRVKASKDLNHQLDACVIYIATERINNSKNR